MLILLPPSETKRLGGAEPYDPARLSHAEQLGDARGRVRAALEAVSGDGEAAAKALKLGVKNREEAERNLVLSTSGAMPAVERYTGVLYDALDVAEMPGDARRWIGDHVAVQSALFGLVAADDRIPAYRLSAGSRLPGLGSPLKRVWSQAHEAVELSGYDLILDLRSQDYAQLAPVPEAAPLHVVQRTADGATRALNHFNKAAKGDLVRRLALAGADVHDLTGLLSACAGLGLEASFDAAAGRVTLVTELGAPTVGVGAAAAAR